jgi:hypothetical protein
VDQSVEPKKRSQQLEVATARQARSAIADVAAQLEPLLNRTIFIQAKARHGYLAERPELERQCDEIESAIIEARSEVILRLMDAPAAVTSHSRVLDLERAIDSLERALAEARLALRAASAMTRTTRT